MPNAPAQPCQIPGCPEFRAAGSKHCARHAAQFAQVEQERRGTAAERGYGSRWARMRKWYLLRNPICITPGCGQFATDVHHDPPVTGPDDPGFYQVSRFKAHCHSCHSAITAKSSGGFGNAK